MKLFQGKIYLKPRDYKIIWDWLSGIKLGIVSNYAYRGFLRLSIDCLRSFPDLLNLFFESSKHLRRSLPERLSPLSTILNFLRNNSQIWKSNGYGLKGSNWNAVDMEKTTTFWNIDNITDTIWLCQSCAGNPYEWWKRPTVIIFAHRQFFKGLIILVLLEASAF
jgi:hypothetical protein